MHGSIRDRLENLISARGAESAENELANHLAACGECSSELASMRSQAEMIRVLRASEEVEPASGFYARVMQRIEESAKGSIWAVFIYSPFAKRLLYASLTITVMLGSYLVSHEALDGHLGATMVAQDVQAPVVAGSPAEQRDAVLKNFASH
jgi:anti-sigma factor RsiW